jgi:hypothetical protein
MMRPLVLMAPLLLAACGEAALPNAVVENSATAPEQVSNGSAVAAENMAEEARATGPLLTLAPEALSLVDPDSGRSRELAFGSPRDMTLTGVAAALGKPDETGANAECGEGAMDFARFDGLMLWFQQGRFAGWFLDGGAPKLTTATGAGIGTTRAQLADALAISDVPDSSLGREFMTAGGSFSGLLDGAGDKAKVTALWSGQACIAR